MEIELFSRGMYGKSKNVTAQNRLNCYLEFQPQGDRSRVAIYGTPGLDLFASFGDTPIRGLWQKGDFLYVVHRGTFYEVNNAAVKTAKGTINTTSGRVYMADNGKQLMLTDGVDGWIYTFNAPEIQTITTLESRGTIVGVFTDDPHNLVTGMEVTISGASPSAFNGTFRVTVISLNEFTYTALSAPHPAPQTISSITAVGTTATLTTAAPHNLTTGSTVIISGTTPAAYSGTFVITVTGANTFTYTTLIAPGGVATVVGSYTVNLFIASAFGTYSVSQFSKIVDEDYPNAETVTWQDGYFVINPPDSQRFYISDINNGFLWDALDFASAESNPDDIVVVASDNGNLHLFGELSTEFWTNTGSLDFPFERISGGANEWGCAARESVVKYDNTLAFLAKNRMGEVIVARMNGYLPQRISNPELEHIINAYPSVSDAVAYSYMLGGHPMLVLNFPSAQKTWLYDGLSDCWSMLKSNDIPRHRTELGINYLNRIIVTDYENGNLYRLNSDSYTDNGEPIVFEVITRHLQENNDRVTCDSIQVNLEAGVGLQNGQGENPQIMLQISKDGGHTYGVERWVSMGASGQYTTRANWHRLGQARDWVFKFRITDPVKRVIFGASLELRKGSS